jgi:hypothetical protein
MGGERQKERQGEVGRGRAAVAESKLITEPKAKCDNRWTNKSGQRSGVMEKRVRVSGWRLGALVPHGVQEERKRRAKQLSSHFKTECVGFRV